MLRFAKFELLTTATKEGFFRNCFFVVKDVKVMRNIAIVSAIFSVYYTVSEVLTYLQCTERSD